MFRSEQEPCRWETYDGDQSVVQTGMIVKSRSGPCSSCVTNRGYSARRSDNVPGSAGAGWKPSARRPLQVHGLEAHARQVLIALAAGIATHADAAQDHALLHNHRLPVASTTAIATGSSG